MAKKMSEDEIYKQATQKVREKKRFYRDLTTYLIVNAVLVVIWALSGRGYMWFLWPLGIWGAFVLGHGLRIFVFGNGGSDQQEIEKEVEKMKKGKP